MVHDGESSELVRKVVADLLRRIAPRYARTLLQDLIREAPKTARTVVFRCSDLTEEPWVLDALVSSRQGRLLLGEYARASEVEANSHLLVRLWRDGEFKAFEACNSHLGMARMDGHDFFAGASRMRWRVRADLLRSALRRVDVDYLDWVRAQISANPKLARALAEPRKH
jgi:hypothetical protein